MKQYCRYCCNVKDIELEPPAPEDFGQQTLF